MAFGITRANGSLVAPRNLAGVSLSDFTLTFWGGNLTALWTDYNAGESVTNGALDQVFRTATGVVGSLSRVGTLNTSTGAIRFAIEHLGADAQSPGFLGTGPTNASPATTAAALQAAVQALGTIGTIVCSSATVVAFTY